MTRVQRHVELGDDERVVHIAHRVRLDATSAVATGLAPDVASTLNLKVVHELLTLEGEFVHNARAETTRPLGVGDVRVKVGRGLCQFLLCLLHHLLDEATDNLVQGLVGASRVLQILTRRGVLNGRTVVVAQVVHVGHERNRIDTLLTEQEVRVGNAVCHVAHDHVRGTVIGGVVQVVVNLLTYRVLRLNAIDQHGTGTPVLEKLHRHVVELGDIGDGNLNGRTVALGGLGVRHHL